MNIQWFPGHMAKTRRLVSENLKLVDVVIELLDSRIPYSSQNPEIDKLLNNKPRLAVLNKSDLADKKINNQWKNWYAKKNQQCIFIDSLKGTGINNLKKALLDVMKDKIQRDKAKGFRQQAIKTMIVGIPNVGKSSLINKIANKACTVTGDRPGVTKSKQWIRLNKDIILLDTPGILWPKFEDQEVGLNLAYTGAIKDEVFDTAEVSIQLLDKLKVLYPQELQARYKLDSIDYPGYELLEIIGRKRGCLVSGGNIDLYRTSDILLDELRSGKIANISLESPPTESTEDGEL
jgi:ribosome biogenesis GTPase A